MRLSNCVNLAQKISAFALVYFFSFSSYQAQIIPDETLVNNSRVNSGYSVCNQNSNLFDNFNEFSIFDSQLQIKNVFDATQLAAASITLSEYLQLSGVQRSMAQSLALKGIDLASFTQNLEGAFQLGQFANLIASSNNCDREFCNKYPIHIRCGGSLVNTCGGCDECKG